MPLKMECAEERDACGCTNRCTFCDKGFPQKATSHQKHRHCIDECKDFWDFCLKKGFVTQEEYDTAIYNIEHPPKEVDWFSGEVKSRFNEEVIT